MKNIDNNIENILKIEGVNAQGYGIIPQAVMFDDRLSPQSKAIYAYLVSYSGSGQMIFPKVTTILSHLKITKNTYYKHFKPLVDLGYIKIEKAKHYLNKNIYILSNAPKMLNYSILTSSSSGILAIDGINGKGFGFIPKLIMKDLRISIKAKALIAFFYSLVQNGYRAFPHRNTIRQIMQLSKDVYYKALNQLIDCNYITVKQRKDKKGKFSVNDYILNTNPNVENNVEINTESIPCPENYDNAENAINTENLPCSDFYDNAESTINTQITPCHKNCDYSEINRVLKNENLPCPENYDNNNNTSNNSSSMILSSIQKLMYRQNQKDDEIKEMIYNLTYIWKYQSTDCKLYRKIVQALIDMLCVQGSAVYNKQTVKTSTLFEYLNDCLEQDTFGLSLRDLILGVYEHYCLLRDKFTIKKPYEYIKSLLFDHIKNFELV